MTSQQTKFFEHVSKLKQVSRHLATEACLRSTSNNLGSIHQICHDTGIPDTAAMKLVEDKLFWW